MKKTARIELKVDPEFKEKVIKAAKKDKRSVNSYIEIAVDEKINKETPPEEAVAFALGTNPLHDLDEAPEIKSPNEDDWLNS